MYVRVSMDAHIAWCSCRGKRPKFRSQLSVLTEGSRAWTQVIWLVEQAFLPPSHLPGSILLLTDYRIQLWGVENCAWDKDRNWLPRASHQAGISSHLDGWELLVRNKWEASPTPKEKNSWSEENAAWSPRGHCQSEVLFLPSRVGEG